MSNSHGIVNSRGIVGLIDHSVSEKALKGILSITSRETPLSSSIINFPTPKKEDSQTAIHQYIDSGIAFNGPIAFSRNGRIAATISGEIYNREDLLDQLDASGSVFRLRSDGEAVAHGYSLWGIEKLLRKIDGSFALAIYDRSQRLLYIARDRYGETPLYYSKAEKRFAFGTTLSEIAAIPWIDDRLNEEALSDYFAVQFVPGRQTILRSVSKILPGEYITVPLETAVPRQHRYHQIELTLPKPKDPVDIIILLKASIQTRIGRSSGTPSVILDGSLPSLLLAAITRDIFPSLKTFSLSPPSLSPTHAKTRALANLLNSEHSEVPVELSQFSTLLSRIGGLLDEPVGDISSLYLAPLISSTLNYTNLNYSTLNSTTLNPSNLPALNQSSILLLSFAGANEIFGGHSYYNTTRNSLIKELALRMFGISRVPPLLRHWLLEDAGTTLSGMPLSANQHERKMLIPGLKNASKSEAYTQWEATLVEGLSQAVSDRQRQGLADLLTVTPDKQLLGLYRGISKQSIKLVNPFLSSEIVHLGINLPDRNRGSNDKGSLFLQEAASLVLPDSAIELVTNQMEFPRARLLKDHIVRLGGPAKYFKELEVPGVDMDILTMLVEGDLKVGITKEAFVYGSLMLVEWYRAFSSKRRELRQLYNQAA